MDNNDIFSTPAAQSFKTVPSGVYECEVMSGARHTAKKGTKGYKLKFDIRSGKYATTRLYLDLWDTPNGRPYMVRDLKKLGVDSMAKMDQPLPRGIICEVRVTERMDDDGNIRNEVKTFEVIRHEAFSEDPFAPQETHEDFVKDVPEVKATENPVKAGEEPTGFPRAVGAVPTPPPPVTEEKAVNPDQIEMAPEEWEAEKKLIGLSEQEKDALLVKLLLKEKTKLKGNHDDK